MYGSVLGASIIAGSVALLPNTSGSKLSMAITLGCLTIGVAIIVVTLTKILATKIFSN